MRISDWSSDVCSSDLPRVGCRVSCNFKWCVKRDRQEAGLTIDGQAISHSGDDQRPIHPIQGVLALLYIGAAWHHPMTIAAVSGRRMVVITSSHHPVAARAFGTIRAMTDTLLALSTAPFRITPLFADSAPAPAPIIDTTVTTRAHLPPPPFP